MKTHRIAAPLGAALLFALAACGGANAGGAATLDVPGVLVPGCEGMSTSIAVGSPIPTCKPGTPAPQPLKERKKVVVAMPARSYESLAPIVMGEAKGEFDKENIELDVQTIPFTDAVPLLAKGQIDFACTAVSAAWMNGVHQEFDVRWVVSSYNMPAGKGINGLYAKAGTKIADLKGGSIGTASTGGTFDYGVSRVLESAGLSIKDVSFTKIPPPASSKWTALDNGAVKAIAVNETEAAPYVHDPRFVNLGNILIEGEGNSNACLAGPSMLEKDPQAGAAWTRAYIRTINTYLTGDYHKNATVMNDLAKAMGVPVDVLTSYPSLEWNWMPLKGTIASIQDAWMKAGYLTYTDPIPEDQLVDRRFAAAAVGLKKFDGE